MLVLCIILIFVTVGIIRGIVLYITSPKPEKYLSYKEYKQYYTGKPWLIPVDDDSDNSETELKLYKELEYLTAHKAMLEDLQRLVEDDLHNSKGNTKANLSRLISLDKQVHTTQQKIEKLKNDLEKLD